METETHSFTKMNGFYVKHSRIMILLLPMLVVFGHATQFRDSFPCEDLGYAGMGAISDLGELRRD